MTHQGSADRAVPAVAVLAAGLALLDPAVVTVALPVLGGGLRADIAGLQWTVIAYTLGLATLAPLAEAVEGRYGYRRAYLTGLTAYAAAAVACGLAPTIEVLIAARLVQGIGAAFVIAPVRAGSVRYLARITVLGPMVCGALVLAGGWRTVFFALALVALVAAAAVGAGPPAANGRPAHTRLDMAGVVLLALGLAGVSFALARVPRDGIASMRVWLAAVAGLLGLVAFALVERRRQRPGVGISDPEGRPRVIALFPGGAVSVLIVYTFMVYAALGALIFFLLIQLQTVAAYTPMGAGAAVLPSTIVMLALAARSRAVAARVGPWRQLVVGPLICTLGTLALLRVGPDAVYWRDILPGTIVLWLGLTAVLPALASAVRQAYPVHLAAARIGQLLAVAAMPMLAGLAGAAYANPTAFHQGYRVALWWCAGIFTAGALTALVGLVRRVSG